MLLAYGGPVAHMGAAQAPKATAKAHSSLPDLAQLPVALAQPPALEAWRLLRVAEMKAGTSYLDPTTRMRVWRATSAVVPQANGGAGHDYADGGWEVSRAWGNGTHTLLVRGQGMPYWLVDFERGSGFRNWRRFPSGAEPVSDLSFTFSADPLTPRIAFIDIGQQLVRFNTASMRIENFSPFPRTFPAGPWLHQDRRDEWFVKLTGEHTATAWNAKTGRVLRQTWVSLNEPRLERNGRYVALVSGGSAGVKIWDLSTNTVAGPFVGYPFAHNASARGFWIATNWDLSAPWAINRVDPSGAAVQILAPSFGPDVHHSGSWLQDDVELQGDPLRQWTIGSTYKSYNALTRLQNAVGFVRSDGGDSRLLCHTYQAGENYWSLPFATSSPDGRIVVFNSNMMRADGRHDLFVAEVPLRP
jgi:hypothetical protein